MKPIVVIIGRSNVGKSTLFNRLTKKRDALVAAVPCLTRDRLYGDGKIGVRPYIIVDTAGITDQMAMDQGLTPDQPGLATMVKKQIRQAVSEADAILFLTDIRAGINTEDWKIVSDLRRTNTPVWLAVNKAEGLDPDLAAADFHTLGIGQPHPISAEHGQGVEAFIRQVLAGLPEVESPEEDDASIRIAVIGRPNVGKSTLVNTLLGEERVIVYDAPGTTRDSIHVPFKRGDHSYILIDTAGVRRRSKIGSPIEKTSVIKSLQAVEKANVIILVIDASQGVADQDAALAGYVLEAGRSLVVAVNKWDAVDEASKPMIKSELERKLRFISFVKPRFLSARVGTGVAGLFPTVERAYVSARKILSTPKLNRVLKQALQDRSAPVSHGRRIKLKYAHQGGKNPPRVIVHGTQARSVPVTYRRYLANRFSQAFQLEGTPVRVEFREGKNPFRNSHQRPTSAGKKQRRPRR
jgi:GTP-binding protein